MATKKITFDLGSDEVLVFFDWITRFNQGANSFADQAEERVLWNIEAMLEKQVVDSFSDKYEQILGAARDRVRDSTD